MNRVKYLSFGLSLALLALSLFFCSGIWAEEVVIGFTGPLSGPGAGFGRDNVNGLIMAVEDVNAEGGITINGKNYTFKLETYDDMVSPSAAVNNARRLRSRSGARVIFNPPFNTVAPLMEINQQPEAEFLLMTLTSTPKIDQLENNLTCAFSPPFTGYLKAFAEAAWERGWRNAAMVVTLGAYGDEWRQEFRKDWEARGGKILADKPANYYTETDFSSQLSAALAAHPDFLLIGGPSEPTGLVIEQARNLGFDGGFILVDQAKMDYIADVVFKGDLSLMNHTFGVARVLDAPSLVIEDFDKRYHQKFGIPNTYEALLNYSALRAVCSAMEAAGTVNNPTAIKAAFPKVLPQSTSEAPTPFLGIKGKRFYVAGSVGFVENGQFAKTHHYVWWAQNRSEFKQAVKNLPEGRVIRNIQLQGYNL